MNSLTELLRNLTVELHCKLVGQPKAECISVFARRLSEEKDVFFHKSPVLTIRGVTVNPDLYITLPEEGFVHLRCEILSENYADDILSYDQYRVYKKFAGIPCYLIKFESDIPRIRVVKNDDIFRQIFEAGKIAQIRGGLKIAKLAGADLREVSQSKILPLFEKEFCGKLAEGAELKEPGLTSTTLKVVEVVNPSKMTLYLTVENHDKVSGLVDRQLLVKFGRREGPNFRFIMDSTLTACFKSAAAATMQELGIGINVTKQVYFDKFCENLSLIRKPHGNGFKQPDLLFQKRENYIYIYSPSVAIVTVKKKDEGSNLLNVYRYLVDEYKMARGIPCLEIVFGTTHPGNYIFGFF